MLCRSTRFCLLQRQIEIESTMKQMMAAQLQRDQQQSQQLKELEDVKQQLKQQTQQLMRQRQAALSAEPAAAASSFDGSSTWITVILHPFRVLYLCLDMYSTYMSAGMNPPSHEAW